MQYTDWHRYLNTESNNEINLFTLINSTVSRELRETVYTSDSAIRQDDENNFQDIYFYFYFDDSLFFYKPIMSLMATIF